MSIVTWLLYMYVACAACYTVHSAKSQSTLCFVYLYTCTNKTTKQTCTSTVPPAPASLTTMTRAQFRLCAVT